MQQPETAQQYLDRALEAPVALNDAKVVVVRKAELYGGLYALALLACLVLIFYHGWFRWIAGFLVATCLVAAWSMRGALASIGHWYAELRWADSVLAKHRVLNAAALMLLMYALLAVWHPWPLPALPVFLAAIINYLHHVGYRASQNVSPADGPYPDGSLNQPKR